MCKNRTSCNRLSIYVYNGPYSRGQLPWLCGFLAKILSVFPLFRNSIDGHNKFSVSHNFGSKRGRGFSRHEALSRSLTMVNVLFDFH